ncbi:MAG: VWA domain-containing protein [Deltaproteobacteria bacterium]|nr:VWA domain-containing protein [Deltaproteobacteria bacterium]
MSKTWVFVINVWLFLYFLCLNAQSSVEIDGWNVSFSLVQRDAQQTVVRYVFTRSSQGAGPLERIVVGHPSCFPKIEILSAELSPSHTGYVVRESDGSVKLARTILTQAPFGVLAMIRDGSQNSYTLDIRYKGYLDVNGSVAIGVADLDPGGCSGGFCRGGKSRILNGVKCDVQTNNFCNASSVRADIAVFLDNSKFVSDSSLQTIKRAIQRFIENAENVTERPRIGVGRYWYGMITVENQSSHNCVINPDKNRCFFPTTQFAYDYYQATQRPEYLFANFVSLTEPQDHYPSCSARDGSDGDFDKNFPDPYFRLCMDYDGFPRVNFGSQSPLTNLYRAVSDGYVCTGGDPSVDSALSVADQVLRSGWGDPQVPNVIILITSGRFLKTSSQVSTRCEASCLNQSAVNEALRVAQGIRQNGTRIFVVHFRQPNDPDLEGAYGCSESQKRLMEEALRSIASDGCYHRVEVNEVETALRSILSGLRFNYTCPNPSGNICSYRCVPLSTGGGRCEPVECPPTPTPTPRSWF